MPGIAPCDFYEFRKGKYALKWTGFLSVEDVKEKALRIMNDVTGDFQVFIMEIRIIKIKMCKF